MPRFSDEFPHAGRQTRVLRATPSRSGVSLRIASSSARARAKVSSGILEEGPSREWEQAHVLARYGSAAKAAWTPPVSRRPTGRHQSAHARGLGRWRGSRTPPADAGTCRHRQRIACGDPGYGPSPFCVELKRFALAAHRATAPRCRSGICANTLRWPLVSDPAECLRTAHERVDQTNARTSSRHVMKRSGASKGARCPARSTTSSHFRGAATVAYQSSMSERSVIRSRRPANR